MIVRRMYVESLSLSFAGKDNLARRKIIQDPGCPVCGLEAETPYHILWGCSSAMDVWSAGERVFQKFVADVGNFRELAEGFFEKCNKDVFRLFAETARQIWFRRNRWIHDGVFTHPNKVARTAAKVVEDFTVAQLGDANKVREKEVRLILWKKPPVGWVKVNCDASLNLAHCRVGLGVAIRDHDGCLIAA